MLMGFLMRCLLLLLLLGGALLPLLSTAARNRKRKNQAREGVATAWCVTNMTFNGCSNRSNSCTTVTHLACSRGHWNIAKKICIDWTLWAVKRRCWRTSAWKMRRCSGWFKHMVLQLRILRFVIVYTQNGAFAFHVRTSKRQRTEPTAC